MIYYVVVGNIGTVHTGKNKKDALKAFNEWSKLSKDGYGNAAGESVTLFDLDGIINEFVGALDNENSN